MPMNHRLLVPRASGFNPRMIANLGGWWDFGDSTQITIETGIRDIADKSGNGRTLSQTTTNNQPALIANAINGRSVAEFDGSNDTIRAGFTLDQPYTIFCVGWHVGANPSSNYTMLDGFSGGNRGRLFWGSATTTANLQANAGSTLTLTGTFNAQSPAIHEAIFNGASSLYAWNGSASVSGNAGANNPGGLTLGAFGTGGTAFMHGRIAEVVLYSRVLTADECTRVRRWLGTRYALTVT